MYQGFVALVTSQYPELFWVPDLLFEEEGLLPGVVDTCVEKQRFV